MHKHQEQIVRNTSRRQKNKFIHHFSRCDPQKAIRGNKFCRLPLLYRTRDPFTLTVPQKGKKQRNSNLSNCRKRQVKPVLATNSCFSSMPSAVPPESPCTSSRAADFHKQNERRFSPRESRYTLKQNGENMSKAYRILQSLTRRLARAELGTEQRLWFCDLPDSPGSSEHAPSSNESDEDDFDYGAFCWSSDCLCQPTQSITPDTSISQEGSIYQPKRKRSRKGVRTREGNGCSCEYRKSPSEDYFWEALTVRNFHDQPLESSGKPRANEKINEFPWNALLRLKAYFRQKRKASTSHIRVWREQNSETQFHLWARSKQVVKTEDLQMHHRPKSTKPNFFRSYVVAKAKSTATGVAIHSKERMYIVNSGASLHMMGLSSRNHREKKTVRHSSNKSGFSDRRWHCGLRHTRESLHQWTWRFSMDTCGERFSVSAIVGNTMQLTWLFLFVADRRNSLNFVSMVAVIKQKAVPSIEFSTAKGHLEREQEVEDTMLDLLQPFTEGLEERDAYSSTPTAGSDPTHEVVAEQSRDEKLSLVATDVVRDTLAEDTKSKKGVIGPHPRGNHKVFTHYPKGLNLWGL